MALPCYSLVDEGSAQLWDSWAELVRENDWSSDDNTVLSLLPDLPSTRVVFAVGKEGEFLGCLVWNEYDEMAFIGYYIVHPSMSGKGLGPKMWKRAFTRIPKHLNVGLRAVPGMTAKYRARDTPYFVSELHDWEMSCDEAREMRKKVDGDAPLPHTLSIADLSDEKWMELLEFDRRVTNRDRSHLLDLFFDCELTKGVCMADSDGKICGYAAVTSTGYNEDNRFKLGPVFASSISDALSLISPLIDYCESISPDATILVKTLSGTVGDRAIGSLIEKEPGVEGTTLFKRPFTNTIDTEMCYIAHNHGGHFDA